MTTLILVTLLICSVAFCCFLYYKQRQLEKIHGKVEEVIALVESNNILIHSQKTELSELTNTIQSHRDSVNKYQNEEELAKQRAQSAADLALKDFEIEAAKRRDEFERKLANELSELEKTSPKAALQSELNAINADIEVARQTLLVQQNQMMEHLKEEDFVNFHSISLTSADLKDIELIRQFEPQLTRQEAFRKLIWTEFIQKPIQALCKVLDAEKVKGIYKITHAATGRMYIGQAVDIAARWKEHCKCALGIGSSSFMTNKFYKAMHDEGIENFTFEILEAGDIKLNEREFYWIDFYNATTFGYNSKAGG